MRTQYNNNQYYQQSSSKGLVFKLIVGILVLVICAGISFYRRSLETVFNVDTVQMSENGSSIVVTVYRDSDYVYYYSVNKADFNCLKNIGGEYKSVISNLPEGFACS
jgi:hypothetical protein